MGEDFGFFVVRREEADDLAMPRAAIKVVIAIQDHVFRTLKFTEAGSVELRLFSRGHGGDVVTLRVEVEDTGIGIPEEGLKVIFDRFEQLDRSSVRPYPGTGLGLAVCHDLVQLMGGEISVESTPDQGSTFRVTLPIADDHEPSMTNFTDS